MGIFRPARTSEGMWKMKGDWEVASSASPGSHKRSGTLLWIGGCPKTHPQVTNVLPPPLPLLCAEEHRELEPCSPTAGSNTAPSQLPAQPGQQLLFSWGSEHPHTHGTAKNQPSPSTHPLRVPTAPLHLSRARQSSGDIPSSLGKTHTISLWVNKRTALLRDDFGIIKVFSTGIFYSFSLSPWQPGDGSTSEEDSPSQYTMCLQHISFITSWAFLKLSWKNWLNKTKPTQHDFFPACFSKRMWI